MSDDLISRKALMEGRVENDPVFIAAKCAPAVDPHKHGRWIYKSTYYELDECNCSECGQLMTTPHGKRMNFCPNCAAKMDGGETT